MGTYSGESRHACVFRVSVGEDEPTRLGLAQGNNHCGVRSRRKLIVLPLPGQDFSSIILAILKDLENEEKLSG